MDMPPTEQPVSSMAVGLAVDTLATAVVLVWGFAVPGGTVLTPSLIGNMPTPVSAGGIALTGLLALWAVYRNSRLLSGVLVLLTVSAVVGSLAGRSSVHPLRERIGCRLDGWSGVHRLVALLSKTIQLVDIEVKLNEDIEQ